MTIEFPNYWHYQTHMWNKIDDQKWVANRKFPADSASVHEVTPAREQPATTRPHGNHAAELPVLFWTPEPQFNFASNSETQTRTTETWSLGHNYTKYTTSERKTQGKEMKTQRYLTMHTIYCCRAGRGMNIGLWKKAYCKIKRGVPLYFWIRHW